MIDAKGRLFGKINLLDLVVILAVLAVGGRFAYKHWVAARGGGAAAAKQITMVVKFTNVSQDTIDSLKVGDMAFNEKDVLLGQVKDIKAQPSQAYIENSAGIRTFQTVPDLFTMFVTLEGPGADNASGPTMNGLEVKVGRQVQMHSYIFASTGFTTRVAVNPAK